jgi:hypothetical protein
VKDQVAARVMAFNETTKTITPLTSSFFAFINHATNDIRSLGMSLAMTTKQILIAAKGEINLENKPELGPTSPTQVNFYTVLSHPAPAEDPTTPAAGDGPSLTVTRAGNSITISWPATFTGFTLQSTPTLTVPVTWSPVGGVANNSVTVNASSNNAFFRLVK